MVSGGAGFLGSHLCEHLLGGDDRTRRLLGWQAEIELERGLPPTIERSGVERLVGASD